MYDSHDENSWIEQKLQDIALFAIWRLLWGSRERENDFKLSPLNSRSRWKLKLKSQQHFIMYIVLKRNEREICMRLYTSGKVVHAMFRNNYVASMCCWMREEVIKVFMSDWRESGGEILIYKDPRRVFKNLDEIKCKFILKQPACAVKIQKGLQSFHPLIFPKHNFSFPS